MNPHHDRRWAILAMLGIAQLMVILDATVVNIALPSAQKALGFTNDNRQWIITAYALAFGSLLLLGGRIADLFGRKWTFIAGLLGFSLASAIGGAAQSFGVLVAARALQGVFGAVLAPSALSLLPRGERGGRDDLDASVRRERGPVEQKPVQAVVGRVEAVDVPHEALSRTIGLRQALTRGVLVDRLDLHRSEDPGLARPVEPDVQRTGVVAQRQRTGAPEDHGVAVGGHGPQRGLERLAVAQAAVQLALGVDAAGGQAAGGRDAADHAPEPPLVLRLGEPVGRLRRHRPVH
jgi:Major Facilitator Superfamily